RRHTRSKRDWSSDVCSSDLGNEGRASYPFARDFIGCLLCFFLARSFTAFQEINGQRIKVFVFSTGIAVPFIEPGIRGFVIFLEEIGRASWRERGERAWIAVA